MDTMCDRALRHASILTRCRRWLLTLGLAASALCVAPAQAQQPCGGQLYPFPFTDVSGVTAPFCPGIMEAYVTGITKGTTATTFSPNLDVFRLQMTTFLQRTFDQKLGRGSRRPALNQWWTPQGPNGLQTFNIGGGPFTCAADGRNIWVNDRLGNVFQIQASTGKISGPWTGAGANFGILTVLGKVWVVDNASAKLYMVDPATAPGAASLVVSGLGSGPQGMAFDGLDIWTANTGGSVSKIDPIGKTVSTVSAGFKALFGIVYDGAHIWVTDRNAASLFKLDSSANIVQTVAVGNGPTSPVFDGANIWVPNYSDNSVTVVQASTGNIVATIPADGTNLLSNPIAASFDGERILITNSGGASVTLFKAADLSVIANVSTGLVGPTSPIGACSDGVNFWVTEITFGELFRF